MKDIRDMKRSDWHRITKRRYTASLCRFQNIDGVVSLIEMQEVTSPIIVSHELDEALTQKEISKAELVAFCVEWREKIRGMNRFFI